MTLATMIENIVVLFFLWNCIAVRPDQVDPTVTIPPGSALLDYLCSGPLEPNITVVLDDGEYRVSSVTSCNIANDGSVMLMGSSARRTIVRCHVEMRAFAFVSVQMLAVERITFINCGIELVSVENTYISNCIFQRSSNVAISSKSSCNIHIANCVFSDARGGAATLDGSTGNVNFSNCTFQNNFAPYGGALMLYGSGYSVGSVSVTSCTFQMNSGVWGGAVVMSGSIDIVIVTNSTFLDNSASFGGAVNSDEFEGNVRITECIFLNNTAFDGGAVRLHLLAGSVSITNCKFENNIASSRCGAVMMRTILTVNLYITKCAFQNNTADYGGAVMLDGVSSGNVNIESCTFQNNSAIHGGAVMLYGSRCNVSIIYCKFQNNHASLDGGAVVMYKLESNVSITNTTFHMNSGYFGGAICFPSLIFYTLVSMSSFTNNTAAIGAAIYAGHYDDDDDNYDRYDYGTIAFETEKNELVLQDVNVKDNHCFSITCAAAIYIKGVKMYIFGKTDTGSHFSSNSPQGAIQGENSFLSLHGYVTFANNIGVNGGAISLLNDSPLFFNPISTVEFSRNVATGYGGAIYSNGKPSNVIFNWFGISKCILRFDYTNISNSSITFIHNHAQKGGHAVYATPIYNCTFLITHDPSAPQITTMMNYFNITPLPEYFTDNQVVSFPEHVNYCGCSDPNLCNGTSQYLTTYPGRTVRLNVTSVDHQDKLSPSVVYTQIDTSGVTPMLGPQQSTQWIGTVCGTIEYQIYGPEMASLKLLLSNDPSGSTTVIHVKLLPCEPGFTLMPDASTSGMKCDCSLFFTSHGVACDTSDGTVTRSKTNWIGVYNNTDPALAETCPLDYCNSAIKKLPLAKPGYLCNGGRTGILCGHCHGNLSVIFGSSKCQECSDMWLTTLVMFAVLGVILVAALFFLNLTITQGTLYGLIFYANIIQVNASIFFNQSTLNPLQVIVSFVNLDLGLPMCFYNGMDDADKAGLQFVFPAYLLILTMATILVFHYCLQRSPNTVNSLFLCRISTIIGERAVGVLSTLIYLSYSKLFRTVIDILTYSTVHLPSGDMYVWFYDGNVQYLRGKHTVLFVVAIATCTLFLLPYTIALTFIPIIEQHSEHNRLFNYLHKKANQTKPMNDAHYAPYKGKWRWWLGARLWLLVVMYTLNPVYSSDKPSLLLTIQATMVILFTIAQASIKPFGQSHQLRHNCNRRTNFYNHLYNCLDMFYLLNYTALAMSMSYILDQSSDQSQITVVAVGVLVGLFVVMLMATVLYHLIVAILRVFKMYDRAKERFNGLFDKKINESISRIEELHPIVNELDPDVPNNAISATTVSVNYGLREPLCED